MRHARSITTRVRPARTGVVAAALLVASLVASGAPAAAGTDTEAEQAEVRAQRSALAEQLDVLSATDAEIEAALDELDAAIADQEAAVAEAEAAEAAAAVDLRTAEAALRGAQRDVELLEAAIVEMAVASYMHPPSADLVQSLQASSLSDAVLSQTYLDARASRDVDLLRLLELAEATATRRTGEVARASDAAAETARAATATLVDLGAEQNRQLAFATDLQDRIDASLAEAAVLADLDAELSEQIVSEQQALLARIPPPPVVVEPAVAPPPATAPVTTVPAPTTTAPAPDLDAVDEPEVLTPTTTAPSPTTTVPRAPAPVTSTSTPPLRTVQGITVHADIADDVDALLRAAAADGVSLSGWGYRSTQRQIELRIQNCGPTTYDIWVRSAGSCSPPTAVPGRSLHEQGRAIDFTSGGRALTSRSSPGFRWLAANASSFGLFNLPSEPWHWSTSGG